METHNVYTINVIRLRLIAVITLYSQDLLDLVVLVGLATSRYLTFTTLTLYRSAHIHNNYCIMHVVWIICMC